MSSAPSNVAPSGRNERLQETFGLEAFRPWQTEAIETLLDGEGRVLVVAPTGGGKSLCYQYPATELEGTTVVVSPLIALMEDQVRSLERRGISATFLASTLDRDEVRRREEKMLAGEYALVYVAPERLRSDYFLRRLSELRPPLVAIDEAHCISQWGHDFRPDYLRLGEVIRRLAPRRLLACTATATPAVRSEIVKRLGFKDAEMPLIMRGFARPNLQLEVEEIASLKARRQRAIDRVAEVLESSESPSGAAIIYAGTRKQTSMVADMLIEEGWRARPYHAGLPSEDRERVSQEFADQECDVVVATNAFGMGIDRPDIRLVVHIQAPGSLEQYYQEVGRGGRDGAQAWGTLLSGPGDLGLRRRLLESIDDDERRKQQWSLFVDLLRYIEAGSCRHDFILRYFGDEREALGGCGHCDVCERLANPDGVAEPALARRVVRVALSGVARFRGRAGLTLLAESLKGQDTSRLRQMGLTGLSTHGAMADRSVAWIQRLLRRLLTADLIDLSDGDFPVPLLTKAGYDTMRGERPVNVLLPEPERTRAARGKRRKRGKANDPAVDTDLDEGGMERFERLRQFRTRRAREQGVPAFLVCSDRTLRAIAAEVPQSLTDLAGINGIGPAKLDAFGADILAVLVSGPS